jgi:hypothetical protein
MPISCSYHLLKRQFALLSSFLLLFFSFIAQPSAKAILIIRDTTIDVTRSTRNTVFLEQNEESYVSLE